MEWILEIVRWLGIALHRLLRRLRAHPAACGFERGKSIAATSARRSRASS